MCFFCPGAAVLPSEVACRGVDTTGRIGHICETSSFVVNTLRLGIDSSRGQGAPGPGQGSPGV